MKTKTQAERIGRRLLLGVVIWVLLTSVLLAGDNWLQSVYLPQPSATLGVTQLPPSDASSTNLRQLEWLKDMASVGTNLLIYLLAWLLWGVKALRLLITPVEKNQASKQMPETK